jgi:hypothetical protein
LAARGDEGRGSLRKVSVRWQTTFDPAMSEWGNPPVIRQVSCTEYIGVRKRTRRTETSKYPEEKKSIEIPLVAASERGLAEQCELVEQSGKSGDTG